MAYATLDQVKLKLGIAAADVSQDGRLNYFLDATCAAMTSVLGDLTLGTKTENISCCDIKRDRCGCDCYIELAIRNATSLDTIDGTVVDVSDYQIVGSFKDRVLVQNLSKYVDATNDFSYFDITYTAGFSPIPDDLAFAQACWIDGLYNQKGGKDVTEEKAGPRSINFGSLESDFKANFPDIVNLYTKICV